MMHLLSNISYIYFYAVSFILNYSGRMAVGFTTTWAVSAYHHLSCEFESHSWRGVLYTTICHKVCPRLVAGLLFSPGTSVFPINKTDHHDITEILLKVALNTIIQSIIIIFHVVFFKRPVNYFFQHFVYPSNNNYDCIRCWNLTNNGTDKIEWINYHIFRCQLVWTE